MQKKQFLMSMSIIIIVVSTYLLVFSFLYIIGDMKDKRQQEKSIPISYQIVEKGEFSKLQYIIEETEMTPYFETNYYIVLRDYKTGTEKKKIISQKEYNTYVLGDTINADSNVILLSDP